MDRALEEFRRAAAPLRRSTAGRGVRYPAGLRAKAVGYAGWAQAQGVALRVIAEQLGITVATLQRWRESGEAAWSVGTLREVVVREPGVVGAASLTLTTPRGLRIEGLELEQVAALVRALEA